MPDPLPLREALPAVWRECRTAPPQPPQGAPVDVHWTYLWRSLLAAALTWQGLAVYLAVSIGATLILG